MTNSTSDNEDDFYAKIDNLVNFFNKEGEKISARSWFEVYGDIEYRRVAYDEIQTSSGHCVTISTVLLGPTPGDIVEFETLKSCDQVNCPDHPDLIFKYHSLQDAFDGHDVALML